MASTKSDGAKAESKGSRNSHACLTCRSAKMRCIRLPSGEDGKCIRCTRSRADCVVPQRQLGRKKGSQNKFTELNRALRQNLPGTDALVDALRLAAHAQTPAPRLPTLPDLSFPPAPPSVSSSSTSGYSPHQTIMTLSLPLSPSSLTPPDPARELAALLGITASSQRSPPHGDSQAEPESGANVLSNPLGLLSDVCADAGPLPAPRRRRAVDSGDEVSLSLDDLGVGPEEAVRHSDGFDWFTNVEEGALGGISDGRADYFKHAPTARLEIDDPEFDPIHLGIVTESEVVELFDFFHTHLRSITLALDPYISTPDFLRKTSPFLLTAVCASASNFLPSGNAGLTLRLYNHFDKLADLLKVRGYRSVSIVHGYTLGTGWTRPAAHISHEKSWAHYTHAASIAVELGLHTAFMNVPLSILDATGTPWAQELALFGEDPAGECEKRLQRHAERIWLQLYLWGSGLARTMGRPWVTRAEDFGPKVDRWHEDPFALPEDQQTVALVNLRALGSAKLLPLVTTSDPSMPYELLKASINRELSAWSRKLSGDSDSPEFMARTPIYHPYPILLLKHIQVLVYSLALKHRPASAKQILADCFRAALGVVQHVVSELEAEASMRYMVNNIASMSLYSGVCAFKCLLLLKPTDSAVPLFLISLLGKLSKLLVHFGTTPSHRQSSALRMCGEHLKIFLARNGHSLLPEQIAPSVMHSPKIGAMQDWMPFTDTYGWFDLGIDVGSGELGEGVGSLFAGEEHGMSGADDFGNLFWGATEVPEC